MDHHWQVALAVAFWFGVYLYHSVRRSKYPHRLAELEAALQVSSDLSLHRNKDARTAKTLSDLKAALAHARGLLNSGPTEVARDWPMLHSAVLHLTSEEMLTRVGLYYTDRREEIRAAVYDLASRLEKKASTHSATSAG